ncbi:hypothetical protein [Uliginosibacterium sediminicola]|jgi:hypothetical protein|uniref:Uncharacterized protein n=1 Tax=Uliginosibacterium sediminicola TaxID=2024550 RepID=A0ABU9YZN2_9RHOO
MKFKAVSWGKWRWRERLARKWARKAPVKLEGMFPLSFVPESSSRQRSV